MIETPNRRNAKLAFGLLTLAVFSVLVRIPFMQVPMITDEGGAAYVAHFWTSDYQPYKDVNYDRLQGFFLIYKAILAVFGKGILAIRLAAALYNIGLVLAVFFLARRMISEFAGWVAGGLAALFSAAPGIEGFTANAELFAVLPLAMAALLTWKKRWFLAGLFAGIAVLFKAIGVSGLLLVLIWIVITHDKWKSVLLAGAGFAIGPGLAAVHGTIIGWKYFWGTFITHRAMAFSLLSSQAAAQIKNFAASVAVTYPAWIALAVLTLVALIYVPGRVRQFLSAWIVASFAGMALGGNWFPHYYTQLIPPLAVAAGAGAACLGSMRGKHRLLWSTATALSACIFIFSQGPFWFEGPDDISLDLYRRPAYLISKDVGTYIRENTKPEDTVYVAFGQAELYYYARRKAAVPQQLYWHQIVANKDLWDAVVDSIRSKKPAMVVWVQAPPAEWSTVDDFRDLINQGYVLGKDLRCLTVYKRRS